MTQALALAGLSSGYDEAVVLRDITLTVAPGEILAVLGKNGMGKSTLLKSIMGFLPKLAGSVALEGQDITRLPPPRIARMGIAYVPQEKALFQDLTVAENLRLALPGRARLEVALDHVARSFPFLRDRLAQRAGTLSGGEQKMLLMARALSVDARVLLVDEISEGLQPSVITRLAGVLAQQRSAAGRAILLIEQNLGFALEIADRYAVLDRGEIVDTGPAAGAAARIAHHLSV